MSVDGVLEKRLNVVQKRRSRMALVRRLFITAAVVYLLFAIIFGMGTVHGSSMLPALRDGDFIFFYRLSGSYQLGDIILIRTGGHEDYIKRVCAVPGDTVDIDDTTCKLLINGEEAIEPYAYGETTSRPDVQYPLVLQEEEYFCLGDNRENSLDSRTYGIVRKKQIDGKTLAFLRIF